MSVGLKNNNYLNVKNGASPWLDAGGKNSKSDSKGHAVFSDPAYGVRAGILLLRTYYFTHNLRTIAQILARWAPATDTVGSVPGGPPNSPKEYTGFVSGRMLFGHSDRLDIFDEDKSIGNLARLRGLFYAMAAYEIGGGFEVPDKVFNAGVELVEPGITKNGTESTYDNTATNPAAAEIAASWSIGGSVGAWEKGAENDEGDVKTVQRMLRNAAMVLNDPSLDPRSDDGKIHKKAAKSDTVQAIIAFQGRFLAKPDGLIGVGGRTWGELTGVLSSGAQDVEATTHTPSTKKCFFPFTEIPDKNWTSAPRSFAANREDGARAHAGCDLYFPQGTVIHAITDGRVVRGPYLFYAGTFALEVDHGSFIARYGEVQESTFVREGDLVTAGQPIAKVGKLTGLTVTMLHLELYDKSAQGPLTVSAGESKRASDGRPFMRRKDLIDPTPKLNAWQANLPGAPAAPEAALVSAKDGIPAVGFCIHLVRKRQEKRDSKPFARTVGDYQCYWNGKAIDGLAGQIAERGGPGDNSTEIGDNQNRRVEKGAYRLAIHDGSNYKTYGYGADSQPPKPGLLLRDTDERSFILIHPGVDYVSSVGCLNPTSGLKDADSKISFADSRSRVIAIIEGMKAKMGANFPKSGSIPNAVILIEREPA